MDKGLSVEENDNIYWDTEDELEIQEIQHGYNNTFSVCMDLRATGQHAVSGDWEASSSSVPCQSKFIQQFVVMGFSEESIAKAIEQNGENPDLVLDALLTFKVLEDSPEVQPSASPQLESRISSDDSSFEYYENFLDDIDEEDSLSSDSDHCLVCYPHPYTILQNSATQCYLQDDNRSLCQKKRTLLSLTSMGYPREEVLIAMERCGPEAMVAELTDFIYSAQLSREEDVYLPEDIKICFPLKSHVN